MMVKNIFLCFVLIIVFLAGCKPGEKNGSSGEGKVTGYRLIAHRGGITGSKYGEYDPASVKAAIDRGYYMLEIDIRMTRDSVLILNHDPDFHKFYNDTRRVDEMDWDEIKKFRSVKGGYSPMTLDELSRMCSGKIKFMLDLKPENPPLSFYKKLETILEKYNMLKDAYFIDKDARNYFMGKAKFEFRVNEAPEMMAKLAAGEDVASNYFLFDNANRMYSEIVKWCQKNSITVVPSVNDFHYKYENDSTGAARDIAFLQKCGVTEFQIDSKYDRNFPGFEEQ